MLPVRRARDDRPRRGRLEGLRVSDRDDLPRAARRLRGGRGADHLRRPRSRRIEDVEGNRRRGDLEGAGPPAGSTSRAPLSGYPGPVFEVTDATFEQDVLQADTPIVL